VHRVRYGLSAFPGLHDRSGPQFRVGAYYSSCDRKVRAGHSTTKLFAYTNQQTLAASYVALIFAISFVGISKLAVSVTHVQESVHACS